MSALEVAVIERHRAEPRIAEELIAMLRRARERGHRTGFRAAWEVLRWRVSSTGGAREEAAPPADRHARAGRGDVAVGPAPFGVIT